MELALEIVHKFIDRTVISQAGKVDGQTEPEDRYLLLQHLILVYAGAGGHGKAML